jgi:predicted DNA-binding transcriptional regulator AlpA
MLTMPNGGVAMAEISNNPTGLLTTVQAAGVLGFNPSFLAKARLTGTGPRFLKIGKAVRYRRADIDAWLADKTRVSTSDPANS